MISLFTENENNGKPPQCDSESTGDGSPERSPAPRGQAEMQAKLVSDDAEAFEEQQTGVALSYVLKEQEVSRCLKNAGFLRRSKLQHPIILGLLAAGAVLFIIAAVLLQQKPLLYVGIVLCAAASAAFTSLSPTKPSEVAKKIADGHLVEVQIYPDRVETRGGEGEMEIPLDGTCECASLADAFVIIVPQKNQSEKEIPPMLILPFRCVGEDVHPYVEAMILAGTKPKELNG